MKCLRLKWCFTSFACFSLAVLFIIPGIAFAIRLDLGSVSGSPGSDVTIPITLNYEGATPNIASTSNDIRFDTSLLDNPRATIGLAGTAATKFVVSNLVSAGVFRVGVIGFNQTVIQNGIVANVTFGIKAGASPGDTSLGNTPSASDPTGVLVAVQGNPGTVTVITETISTPMAPNGGPAQGTGTVGTSYAFNASGATSSRDHPVEYQFDWEGDGTILSGYGAATQSITFTVAGTYFIRARARCSQDTSVVSFWSRTLTVRILPAPPSTDHPPFGSFDIPLPDATISSVVQVGGWALDDVMVMKVELRSDIPFWPYIGDLYYTCGTRPDVEAMYPTYPNNDCAGFGYMWMTNSMSETIDPQTGRRLEGTTHRFYLRIYDTAGHSVDIGHRNLTLRNDTNPQPFGAMDLPLAGEIVSGPINISGWALAKGGWRVNQASVRLDGVVIGQATYGLNWPALAEVFPVSVYPYSENAAYVYSLDTTLFSNGQHALDVVVADEVGNLAGIGSRYIYIQN